MSTSHESPTGALRIGDAERVAAASALGDHFAAGRLDQAEFDSRLSAAYAARVFADLDPLFADLPEPHPARPAAAAPPASPAPVREDWTPPWGDRVAGARRRGGRAWAAAAALPAAPVPVLIAGGLLLLLGLTVAVAVVALAPFVLIPLFWIWCVGGRAGTTAAAGTATTGAKSARQ
jgi:hypothetical protein